MTENTKSDIPHGSGIDPIEETSLDLPNLPNGWEWGSANHTEMTNKVNVFFGRDIYETGGQYGEIDNWVEDGDERWTLHVRPIVDAPNTPNGNIPRETAETSEEFDSLDAAIESVPSHISTYYD